MSLKEINLKTVYYSDEDNLLQDFYVPVLSQSIKYKRIVGYFCSNSLAIAARGIANFITNGGEIELITSVELTQDDQKAIKDALLKKEEEIIVDINNLEDEFKKDHIKMLGWMVKNNKITIKIAVVNYGIEHKKVGILEDSKGNIVSFSGSDNETIHGWMFNDEQFHVFCSWKDGENEHLLPEIDKFEQLWQDKGNKVRVYSVSDAFKEKLIKIAPRNSEEFEKISKRTAEGLVREPGRLWQINTKETDKTTFFDALWYFQKEAIINWEANDFKGIFSMATGTGKTKTAVGGIIKLKEKINNLFVIITCPQNTIIKQWEQEINTVELFAQGIIADSSNAGWPTILADKTLDFNRHYLRDYIVYTTYNTLSSEKFIKIISKLDGNILLVCDEVHWAGADIFQEGLLPIFKYRLGLSATPERYMDEEGSDIIKDYFGKVVYEFSLERALKEQNPATGKSFLCPYNYYPIFVELSGTEREKYFELTEKIKRQYAKEIKFPRNSEYYQRLCEQRQDVIVDAEAKFTALNEIIDLLKSVEYLLIYCSPNQIDKVQNILNHRSIINHRFTGEEGTIQKEEYDDMTERDYIIANFENGKYSALVAMKCLDEGINILRAESGILMASSGNTKQYIQRRGRLLRRHKDKHIVNIYDIIVVPYLDAKRAQGAGEDELKILRKEFRRYEEFASCANNELEAMNSIFEIKKIYNFYSRNGGVDDKERGKPKNSE